MPNITDPREVEKKIKALEDRVKALEAVSIPFLSYQKGAIAGQVRAASVGPGVLTSSAMNLQLDGNQPGVAPRQTVTDSAGQVRVELGNLAASGSSPAQFGLRTLDGSGAVLMDSFGFFDTMKPLNFAANVAGQTITGAAGAFSTITGSSFTATIPNLGGSGRNLNILYWVFATFKGTVSASGKFAYVRGNIVGFNTTASIIIESSNFQSSSALWFFPPGGIPPGTYTVQMEGAADTGTNNFINQFFHQVWLAGST